MQLAAIIEELSVMCIMNDESQSANNGSKIQKEKVTVEKFIHFYCEKKHGSSNKTLCSDCQELLEHSNLRLTHCRYQEEKPTCRKCPVHCYRPEMREKIRDVMRFSGPRYALHAPLDWIRHQIRDRSDERENI